MRHEQVTRSRADVVPLLRDYYHPEVSEKPFELIFHALIATSRESPYFGPDAVIRRHLSSDTFSITLFIDRKPLLRVPYFVQKFLPA